MILLFHTSPPSSLPRTRQAYRDKLVTELAALSQSGAVVMFFFPADGSAKWVKGWMQAGFGIWLEGQPSRYWAHAPIHERHSVSRAELPGLLRVVTAPKPKECLVVMLDSQFVDKGKMEWSLKWLRHGWRTVSMEVGHRDLWEAILLEREAAGGGGGVDAV